jgi:hypothetical protein
MGPIVVENSTVRLRETGNLELKVESSIEIETGSYSVWEAIQHIACWPDWFGWAEMPEGLVNGPHSQAASPFVTLLSTIHPLRGTYRSACLTELMPLVWVSWQAKGQDITGTHRWSITPLESYDKPRVKLSVTVTFEQMTQWYFSAMGVEQKIKAVCQELLETIKTESLRTFEVLEVA